MNRKYAVRVQPDIGERSPPARRVVVFGEIFSENVGDGVIFDCLRHGLNTCGVEVFPADFSMRNGYSSGQSRSDAHTSSFPRKLARYAVRRSLTIRRMITLVKWWTGGRASFIRKYTPVVQAMDGVIIGGGQLLVDRQLGFPLKIGAVIHMARTASKPLAVFSCGADARQGLIARIIYRRLLRYSRHNTVRDRMSARSLLAICRDANVEIHPDIGFLAADVYSTIAASRESRKLGINVMPYETVAAFSTGVRAASRNEFIQFWIQLIDTALASGWEIDILTNGDHGDFEFARTIHEKFEDEPRVRLAQRPTTPDELIGLLAGIEALITSRMHAGIVAYSLGKTVVPLVWDEKVRGVWKEAAPSVNLVEFDDTVQIDNIISTLMSLLISSSCHSGQDGRNFNRVPSLAATLKKSCLELTASMFRSAPKAISP